MLCLYSVLISFLLKYPIKTLKGYHTDVSDSLGKASKRRLHEKHYLISRSKFWLMSSRFWWKCVSFMKVAADYALQFKHIEVVISHFLIQKLPKIH